MVIAADWRRRMVHLQSAVRCLPLSHHHRLFPEEEEEVVDSMIQTASVNMNPSNPMSSERCSSRKKYSPLSWYFKCR